ncbi:MAG TPA: hypothetical protein VGD29_01290 [Actinoplanes sp.]|jgi:hypothetical protein
MTPRELTRAAISATLHCLTVPVNRRLIARGKGHALVHQYHHAHQGARFSL